MESEIELGPMIDGVEAIGSFPRAIRPLLPQLDFDLHLYVHITIIMNG